MATTTIQQHPAIKWAETNQYVYVTFMVPNCRDPTINISSENDTLAFSFVC